MPKDPFQRKFFIMAGILAAGLCLLYGLSQAERTVWHQPLKALPFVFGNWQGMDLPLDPRVQSGLGVDDYLYRGYQDTSGQEVELYIGYYNSQRTGDTIHSPKNCLPGSGWEPVTSKVLSIDLPEHSPIRVNEYLVEKGLERRLVLYWYQGRGRVVASEYAGKAWLLLDSIRLKRTDGAVIRLVSSTRDGEAQALGRAVKFARALYPKLGEFIPN